VKNRFAHYRNGTPPPPEIAPSFVPLGVDPKTLDPRAVLASIAADIRAPAMARVAACKVLLIAAGTTTEPDASALLDQRIAKRALDLLAHGRPQ
jgi:hypothetical protein